MTELWYPPAKRISIPGCPGLAPAEGRPKAVMHTTEGRTSQGALSAFRANRGDAPTFLISPVDVFQFMPAQLDSYSLQHPPGTPETNRAGHVVQIEQVGFAAETAGWNDHYYERVHELLVWCHHHLDVPLTQISDGIAADFSTPHRIPPKRWAQWSGVCGHVHAPSQPDDHTDPGRGYHAGKAIHGV